MGQWPSIEERLWSKVDKSGECWIWLGSKSTGGYGQISYKGKMTRTHRVAYELANGPIPEGHDVCHNCPGGDNPLCCNPAHLWAGTTRENIHDRDKKGRTVGAKGGQDHFKSKLSDADVLEIRELSKHGTKQKAIAKLFGISAPAVSYIVSRATWKHI